MRIFWNKNAKITSASGAPRTPIFSGGCPHIITLAYYCKSVEFISSAKCVLLPSKKERNNCSKCFASSSVFVLIFHFKL